MTEYREEIGRLFVRKIYIALQQQKYGISFVFNSLCRSKIKDILCFDKYINKRDDLFIDLLTIIGKEHILDTHVRILQALRQITEMCIAYGRIKRGEFTFPLYNGQIIVD